MLRCLKQPAVCYDLVGLAQRGLVTVGRESDATVRLDSPEIPFLLSRKHATLQFQTDGRILLADLGSTNGTYAAKAGQSLKKLKEHWELQDGDVVGFGGPESIVVHQLHVGNPFIFTYYANAYAADECAGNACQSDQQSGSSQDLQVPSDQATGHHLTRAAHSRVKPEELCGTSGCRPDNSATEFDNPFAPSRAASLPSEACASGVMKDILATHLSCPICHDWLVACHTLSCGHMYCGLCLVSWLNENQSCPSCRKEVAGVPVRCFQIDSTINDLLVKGVNVMSPSTKTDREQKQRHWDAVQSKVVPDWAHTLYTRKQAATEAAARNARGFMPQPMPPLEEVATHVP